MFRLNFAIIRRTLVKAAMVVGIVAVTVLAMRVFGPQQTAAQPAQQDDVRATSFTLVGADGTVLARLAPGGQGNGNLTVFDTAGRPRAAIAGTGQLFAFDANGKPRAGVGYNDALSAPFVSVYGENGFGSSLPCLFRASIHLRADASYGLDVCDADGNLIYTAP